MRILIATDVFPPRCGGSGWSAYHLARGLADRGHTVEIVKPLLGSRGIHETSYDGLAVTEFGLHAPAVPVVRNYVKSERFTAQFARYLERRLAARPVDLIHGQHAMTIPPAVEAARRAGIVSVSTIRDYWPVCYWSDLLIGTRLCPGCSAPGMVRCLAPRAGIAWPVSLPIIPYMRANLRHKRAAVFASDAVIAVSSRLVQDLRERAPGIERATRLAHIPNLVDVDRLAATAARAPAFSAPQPFALYVGKLAANKGIAPIVDALADRRFPWPLVVAGEGPERDRMERRARARGLDVRFLGWTDPEEVARLMARAALLLFPSLGPESLSRVLLEAGALGVPIAAMNTGGTADIVRHGETGLLSASAAELAGHAAELAANEALRARLGAAARAHVRAHFARDVVLDQVEALYRDVLQHRLPGHPETISPGGKAGK